ncbi:hypothetical protein BSL78_27257 [Apostichopus japonicus]|uniref:Death domain-containing protein n=1 Tax=Stichopus japonicus TaxID=307972 RepID=A0A2G8JJJ6_STIJA|nr:hypothetical protein BSL78_27257 [Apostichopus japonicus]
MAGSDVQDQDNTALASESLLQNLAEQLGEWRFLGRHLGLTEGNLHDIEQNNKGDSKEMKYQTLLQWKRTSAKRATIGCLANALEKVGRADLAESVMQDGPVETTLTLHDVKDLLSEELTVQDCYEIAIFLGLQARYVQEIKKSQNSAVDLIDKINNGKGNSDLTINALLFAFKKRGMIRVKNLILHSEGLPSSIKARASSEEDILPACVCGDNSYKELKSHSDESVVSLLCNSCAAEWFPTTESATKLL